MPNPKLNFIFINGRIAAGKDTQAKYLLDLIPKSVGLSTGEIYRSAKSGAGEYAKYHSLVAPYLDLIDNQGGLLPDDVITDIVGQVVTEKAEAGFTTFVFTGFPRTIPQLESTDAMIKRLSQDFEVNATYIGLAVLEGHTFKRSEQRRKSAIANGEQPREDDEPAMVSKRLDTYRRLTEPMLHLLAREKRLVIIKGNGNKEDLLAKTLGLQERLTNGFPERK